MSADTLERPATKKAVTKPIAPTYFVSSQHRLVRFRVGTTGFAVFESLGDLIVVDEKYAQLKGSSQEYINGIMRQRLDVEEVASPKDAFSAKTTAVGHDSAKKKRDSAAIMKEKLKK